MRIVFALCAVVGVSGTSVGIWRVVSARRTSPVARELDSYAAALVAGDERTARGWECDGTSRDASAIELARRAVDDELTFDRYEGIVVRCGDESMFDVSGTVDEAPTRRFLARVVRRGSRTCVDSYRFVDSDVVDRRRSTRVSRCSGSR